MESTERSELACDGLRLAYKTGSLRVGNRRYEQGALPSMPVKVIDCDRETGHLRRCALDVQQLFRRGPCKSFPNASGQALTGAGL